MGPRARAALLLLAAVLACGAGGPTAYRWTEPDGVRPPPVPAENPMSAAKVELGRRLFYDADLSIDGTVSCASCTAIPVGATCQALRTWATCRP